MQQQPLFNPTPRLCPMCDGRGGYEGPSDEDSNVLLWAMCGMCLGVGSMSKERLDEIEQRTRRALAGAGQTGAGLFDEKARPAGA
jgi:hypothetical protein